MTLSLKTHLFASGEIADSDNLLHIGYTIFFYQSSSESSPGGYDPYLK